jgi:hypothetical protein
MVYGAMLRRAISPSPSCGTQDSKFSSAAVLSNAHFKRLIIAVRKISRYAGQEFHLMLELSM